MQIIAGSRRNAACSSAQIATNVAGFGSLSRWLIAVLLLTWSGFAPAQSFFTASTGVGHTGPQGSPSATCDAWKSILQGKYGGTWSIASCPSDASTSFPQGATYRCAGLGYTCENNPWLYNVERCANNLLPRPSPLAGCTGVIDASPTPPPTSCPAAFGHPIYPLTGAKKYFVPTGVSIGGIELMLTYDTTPKMRQGGAFSLVEAPSFGSLWRTNFHHKLLVAGTNASALLSRGDGDIIQFKGGSSGFAVSGAVQHRLAVVAGGYLFSDAKSGTLEMFDSAGNLRTLTTAGSMTLTFAYDGTHLTKVTASDGRALMFSYAGDKITSVTAPDWTTINASYDAQDNLVGLNWPDGKTFGFVYGHPNLSWAMTGTVDEKGLPFTEYAYDAFGRATSTQLAGGAEHFSVTYSSPPVLTGSLRYDPNLDLWIRGWGWTAPAGTSVSLPGGALTALGAQVAGGIPVVVSRDQPAGSGCGAATSRQAYDTAVGNVLWREDFTGSRTCYSYDTSNRETARIEGLPADTECSTVNPTALPNGARKITTAWHPDWSMPTVVTEALKVTTLVYHGTETPSCTTAPNRADGKPAPVVCQRIEQALLAGVVDTSVPARVERFTYDSVGRVTSRTDANSNATTYAYYPSTSFVGDAFDPNIAGVALLLHADSPNGSAVVSDSSVSRHPVTKVGNAALSTAQYRFGGVSLAFDASGAGGYVSIPNSADFAFGSGDFTIEAFVYKTANNPNASRIWNPNGDFYDGVALGIDASGNFYAAASTTGNSWPYSLSPANLANNHWYHLAVVRSGGSLFAFVDGVRYVVTTALGSAVLYADSHDRVIGGQAGVNRSLNGYVDEFRITRGVARYTANFTPPTAPFADTGPTKDSVGHTAGDLQSVTNAANQATQYTSYDPAGRVRQMVDPKGITTDIKYTPRGWVDTVTVTPPGGTGRVTHYEYDSAGLLTGVNLPDGTALSYGYDPVHRLTSITDARGNSITYTLDNLSNRTVEEVRDASGTLKRTVSRVFDALNRVQQVTGSQQ